MTINPFLLEAIEDIWKYFFKSESRKVFSNAKKLLMYLNCPELTQVEMQDRHNTGPVQIPNHSNSLSWTSSPDLKWNYSIGT